MRWINVREKIMLSYLFIGANDVRASLRFYDAVLAPLGYEKNLLEGHFCFSLSDTSDKSNGPGSIHIAQPFDGEPATVGNGIMPALRAHSCEKVDEAYIAGLNSGGTGEGKPGIRDAYTENFYVAYLRDPVGNKLAVFFKG
ncbi:glyoxalase/bleomycin resistance protein/dioxygenase [Pseudomonas fluorescens]|uniref:Glyoxalase/bleomycin resistance protein/dioxygenase n=2 Tax=Pseudomonas fluorescens TaxID=294 RepID=A0A3S4P7V1_PSEFL|nr:glyoxalase/bleomycin resistance protein/dioxygenase [Pseudomonas fluorescens]